MGLPLERCARQPRYGRPITVAALLIMLATMARPADAQQFALTGVTGENAGTAVLSRSGLIVTDRAGVATRYDREPRYDSADRRYLGFIDRDGGRALRFPVDGNGAIQLADLNAPRPQFAVTELRVAAPSQAPPGYPAPGNTRVVPDQGGGFAGESFQPLPMGPIDGTVSQGMMTTRDAQQRGWVLDAAAAGPVRMAPPAAVAGQFWAMLPVELGLVRLQLWEGGALWSLAATSPAGPAVLQASSDDPRQLWRVVAYGAVARLDSVAFPGRSLAGGADGLVRLERTSGAAAQQWLVDYGPPPPQLAPPVALPTVQLADHRIVANPPLPAVEVLLTNSHQNDLYVVIAGLRPGRGGHQLIVPAGGSVAVPLSRDAGGTLYETYEVRSPAGVLASEELVTVIPPATLYDVSVYERFMQSIAIDRTGKSPSVIEDINYQPRSVGIFPLPPGAALVDGAMIDVWAEARMAGNPGGVRPLAADPAFAPHSDPLQRALEEATR